MKKQQKIYLLLGAVLIIWGIIGYQIYTRLNPPSPKLEALQLKNNFIPEKSVKNTFYEVTENYRDPFLGKFPSKKTIKKRVVKSKKIIDFPNIIYNGMIEGNTSKSFILTINNHQQILKLGQSIQKIKLLKANAKEAIVIFEGIQKKIPLHK